ncbi:MAG: hypothetical protein JNM43_12540 [Planctomycetaceae bacterium]|nr:hypothetical protein [Planctomycetaceae bacterium]
MLRYALTIFVSAFLLFQVQPLIGRFILPWFGGGPSIWTACMLFFQILLLGGYLYAHLLTTKLSTKTQAIVHLGLLAISLAFLPIAPSASWKPTAGEPPLSRILLLLTATVGGPYFLLSTTGPLMQRWFSRTTPGQSPYRLYALSNVGSLLALLSYPFVFEPWLKLRQQVFSWTGLYAVYVLLAGWCAFRMLKWNEGSPVTAATQRESEEHDGARPSWGMILLWLLLSSCGSIMLLATTNQLCIDVATVPFLWILPLSLYLISFIICFDSPKWYDRRVYVLLMLFMMPLATWVLDEGPDVNITLQVIIYSVTLFVCCMTCHGELVQSRPGSRYLTLYFVIISAGGALGGTVVALVAPRFFQGYWEYHVGLFGSALATVVALVAQKVWLRSFQPWFWIAAGCSLIQIACHGLYSFDGLMKPLTRSNEAILMSVYGLIHFVTLLLVGRAEPRRWVVITCLAVSSMLQVMWLLSFPGWKSPEVLHGDLILATILSAIVPCSVAVSGLFAVLRLSPAKQQWALRGVIVFLGVMTVITLNAHGEMQRDRMIALSTTFLAGILLDYAATSFFGPGQRPIGFTFWVPATTLLLILGMQLKTIAATEVSAENIVHVSRNFYGVLRVRKEEPEYSEDDDEMQVMPGKFSLTHGQIRHGFQFTDDYWRKQPTTYYGRESGVGLAISISRDLAKKSDQHPLKVGVVGLGTGTLAAYGEPGESFRFYDINPDVLALSENGVFTYLKDCQADRKVVLGDARIMMEHELSEGQSQQFDVLAIDAFSSDAIPVHLLTTECAEIYRKHIRKGGILAIHISNRFLDLEPITRGIAEDLGWQAILIDNDDDDMTGVFSSSWVLLTDNASFLDDPTIQEAVSAWEDSDRILHWTDDYSGLWQVLSF